MIAACSPSNKPIVGAPWMQKLMNDGPANSPPLFKQGWQDGCQSAMAAQANHYQKLFYDFKQDPELSMNDEYYTGWKTSFEYCQRYLFQYYKREFF